MALLKALAPRRRAFAVIGAIALLGSALARPASTSTREVDLKAVFLFQFAHFVTWPAEAFPSPESPFVIGILGDDPFGATLDEVVANETAQGRPMVVKRFREPDQIDLCHVLYVSPSEEARLGTIIDALAGRHVLTVGEREDFTKARGIVRFFVSEKRLRLAINLEAAEGEGLTISSKLLRQARIVGPRAES